MPNIELRTNTQNHLSELKPERKEEKDKDEYKIDRILEVAAKKMVAELSKEKIKAIFYEDDSIWGAKLKTAIINVLPENGELVKEIALWIKEPNYITISIQRINDEEFLEKFIYSSPYLHCQIKAVMKISDFERLYRIIKNENIPYPVKVRGMEKINDPNELEMLVNNNSIDSRIQELAEEKYLDQKHK